MMKYGVFSLKNILPIAVVCFLILLFLIISIRNFVAILKEHPSMEKKVLKCLFSVCLLIISSYLFVISSQIVAEQIKDYVIPYKNDNYSVVSGRINKLKKDGTNGNVSFFVNDIEFDYYPVELLYLGVNKSSIINENDIVEIKYIAVDQYEAVHIKPRNAIMEIEIEKDNSTLSQPCSK